jgi:sortase A
VTEIAAEKRRHWLLRGVESVLWVAGGALVALSLWMVADAVWFQHRAARELAREWRRPTVSVPSVATQPGTAPRRTIPVDTPLAELSIPRLGMEAVVAEGDGDGVLQHAVGHLPESARPGEDGNVAIAGHRDTFFRDLKEVRAGDRIELANADGVDTYRVEWTAVVEPWQVSVVDDAGYPALTLVTCYPFHYVGHAPHRYIVRARRIDEVARQIGDAG